LQAKQQISNGGFKYVQFLDSKMFDQMLLYLIMIPNVLTVGTAVLIAGLASFRLYTARKQS
jgi:hypothetical protein